MQALNRKNDSIFLDSEHITNLVTSIIALLRQRNKKLLKIDEKIKEKVNTEISSNCQFIFMDEIKEDIDAMFENNERPETPKSFVPPAPLKMEEIKDQTKKEDKNFVQTS